MDAENSRQFGTLPKSSESFGNVPQPSEPFGTIPHLSERKENHIYTVRQAARMFEDAGVPRTERSITNWCRPDASGVSRLDAFYDMNERKYFITLASLERAIAEEKAKGNSDSLPNPSESTPRVASSVPHASEEQRHTGDRGGDRDSEIEALRKELMDLKILNSGKDFYIKKMEEDRAFFLNEHKEMTNRMIETSQRLGYVEAKLLQIEAPKPHSAPVPQSVHFTEVPAADENSAASLN